jgi:hypothetical protein
MSVAVAAGRVGEGGASRPHLAQTERERQTEGAWAGGWGGEGEGEREAEGEGEGEGEGRGGPTRDYLHRQTAQGGGGLGGAGGAGGMKRRGGGDMSAGALQKKGAFESFTAGFTTSFTTAELPQTGAAGGERWGNAGVGGSAVGGIVGGHERKLEEGGGGLGSSADQARGEEEEGRGGGGGGGGGGPETARALFESGSRVGSGGGAVRGAEVREDVDVECDGEREYATIVTVSPSFLFVRAVTFNSVLGCDM